MLNQFIQLNSEQYRIIRQPTQQPIPGLTARRWEVERIPVATTVELPPNVRVTSGTEFIITENTWHRGIWGDRDAPPGAYHYAENIEARYPGRLFHAGAIAQSLISFASLPMGADPIAVIEHMGTVMD